MYNMNTETNDETDCIAKMMHENIGPLSSNLYSFTLLNANTMIFITRVKYYKHLVCIYQQIFNYLESNINVIIKLENILKFN